MKKVFTIVTLCVVALLLILWAQWPRSLRGEAELASAKNYAISSRGDGERCIGIRHYSDIAPNAEVEILDVNTNRLATAHLGEGILLNGRCTFQFKVDSLHASRSYSVGVGGNARRKYREYTFFQLLKENWSVRLAIDS